MTFAPVAPVLPSIESAAPPSVVVSPPDAVQPRPVVRKQRPQLREVVTQFYPLMDTPPPPGLSEGTLVRASLPASALRKAGFEVEGAGPDDKVDVDVLMGEEGLARAIRFVSYQQ